MSCPRTELELVAFHFGTVSATTRGEVEQHLLGCRACLGELLALKRAIETAELEPRPSAAARARLREAVAQQLGARLLRPRWLWWERPLAFGFATAAVAVAMVALHALNEAPGAMPHGFALESVRQAPGPAQSR